MLSQKAIATLRLQNQRLSQPAGGKPADVVRHLVAMQAQDYFGGLWAVGQRMQKAVESEIEAAYNAGRILRTHLMRPTWHFVAAEDIRWLLKLTAPRVHAANAYMYRQNDLDGKVLLRAHKVIEKALAGGENLTRDDLKLNLEKAKLKTSNLRLAYIVMHAELEGLICSGPRQGRQFTYALLDDRAPRAAGKFDREKELTQFALRFFMARGPATVQDFSYWSGLSAADARLGVQSVRSKLAYEVIDKKEYWFAENVKAPKKRAQTAYLLPNYDEYVMSYKDHGFDLTKEQYEQLQDYSFSHLIVIDGMLIGTWRRSLKKNEVEVETWPFKPLDASERKLIAKAIGKYQVFLQRPVKLIS